MKVIEEKLILTTEELEIYQNFNVFPQSENLNKLEGLDRLFLLFICSKNHESEEISENCASFMSEMNIILDSLESSKDLIGEYTATEFSNIIMKSYIPNPYTKEESRNIRRESNLNTILKK